MSEPASIPQPRPGIMDIAAYVPGRSKAAPGVKLHKLSSNETPLGPSEAARQAYLSCAAKLEDYPDGSATMLREAIAAAHGLNAANIVCGNGSDELLELLARCYLGPGDEALFSRARLPRLQDRHAGRRRDARGRAGARADGGCRRDPCTRDAAHEDRVPRQSQQSDRHLSADGRGAPPACRPAEERAAGDRRGLCRICPPQ